MSVRTCVAAALLALCAASTQVPATTVREVQQRVGLDQHLGRELPAGLQFADERGDSLRLRDLMGGRPAILALVYYSCPNLCTLTLTSLARSLRTVDLRAGRDFEVIAVSIDPRDTPALAAVKRAAYVREYLHGAPLCDGCDPGWHFLTGRAGAVQGLAQTVGFRYFYDPIQQQYAHPSGIIVLTPSGRVAQYFNGIEFPPPELRRSLLQASAGRPGTLAEQLWLLCFHYDALVGPYSAGITASLRILGALIVLALAALIVRLIATSP